MIKIQCSVFICLVLFEFFWTFSQVADAYAQGKLGVGKATVVEPTGMEALKLQ